MFKIFKRKQNKKYDFLRFRKSKRNSNYYKIADIIVMPSEYETWGLSINEAMASKYAAW